MDNAGSASADVEAWTLVNYLEELSILPLSPICNPYKISANNKAARTGRMVLLSGGPNQYKSCVPLFAQPSEARHAIREIYYWRLQNPDRSELSSVDENRRGSLALTA
jgi:hypothetical protein